MGYRSAVGVPGEQAVDSINGVFGRHAGCRAAHAKGTVCRGTFSPSAAAATLTRAAFMHGEPVDATVRFSNASGDPTTPDGRLDFRGMAVKLHLADGSHTDIVASTLPCFAVRTPEDFVAFMNALARGPRRARRALGFLLRHRETWPLMRRTLRMKRVPSYANCRYNGVHAFRWIDGGGHGRHVRYSWRPEAGERTLRRRAARGLAPQYLQRDLAERLREEPVRFELELQLAGDGDATADPTAIWPRRRELVSAGTLEVTATAAELDDARLVFDPTRVTDGIEPSADPILGFRPLAYAVSAERRS
jgi:catalase